MINGMRSVAPARPAAGYIGGKRQLARRLVTMIDGVEHQLYGEPFVGMGGVFLRRSSAPKTEVINDRDRDVATFFRIPQRHYEPFMDMLKWRLTSRAEFERLVGMEGERLTDLERAARFLYLQRLTFGGKVSGRSFGIDTHGPARFDTNRLAPLLEAIHERLAGVWIECLDWREFIARWDRPHALFYLDPPYYGTERCYRAVFPREDHEALAEVLRGLQGRFILTMNDCSETQEIYGGFDQERVELSYTAGGADNVKRAGEIIVSRLTGCKGVKTRPRINPR
jgi:DNA adenine methylase